jgi:hypothetical protein
MNNGPHAPTPRDAPQTGAEPRTSSFAIGPCAEIFSRIADPDVNVAVWDRPADPALQGWLLRALPGLPTFDGPLAVVAGQPDIGPLVELLPDHPLRDRLAADLTHLSRLLVSALPTGLALSLVASFGPVRDDLCRKFHVDWVTLRLLTTWFGLDDPRQAPAGARA